MLRKFVSFTFILYILILLSQPCTDVFALGNDGNEPTVASVQNETPTSQESGGEACSPFCACSCCSLSVASQNFTVLVTIDAQVGTPTLAALHYTPPYNKTYQNNVFQPPKA
jgi:hypothetical protein